MNAKDRLQLASTRSTLPPSPPPPQSPAEGGCGVIGLSAAEPVAGKHLLEALVQMRNRGNGKGGGIAAAGLDPAFFGVDKETLQTHTLLAIGYLDKSVRERVEKEHIHPHYQIAHIHEIETLPMGTIEDLEVEPPFTVCYFVRAKVDALELWADKAGVTGMEGRTLEDEFVYRTSYHLNLEMYGGEKAQAFVLSHGRDLLVAKMVGYGGDVIRHYKLENLKARVWIGHHRYPTKGRVWHPGGAHPFIGLNEALVHNGDFANYHAVREYLAQKDIHPLFHTDTEVSALVFDLHHRLYGYGLEAVIESLAPTTEGDFAQLPPEKQDWYAALQRSHIHGSPDGPWFFLIAHSNPDIGEYKLVCITDTSMLRPQVFAIADGECPIAFASSELQGIDAALRSLSSEDHRFCSRPDHVWNARGGSHTDGGAFILTSRSGNLPALEVTNKFGDTVTASKPVNLGIEAHPHAAAIPTNRSDALATLIQRTNERIPMSEPRSHALATTDRFIALWANEIKENPCDLYSWVGAPTERSEIKPPSKRTPQDPLGGGSHTLAQSEQTLVIDARNFPQEGIQSVAREIVHHAQAGWHRFVIVHNRGHRFIGNGLGPHSQEIHIDIFGAVGDYLASGLDGATIVVHGSAQDQLAQIMKSGKLVVHGDVGQAFGYGIKGGDVFVLGNAAGRPLINGVGKPRVVINGTCLDYLAESFMAGDALNGGGYAILNALQVQDDGSIVELPQPYPGGNLFSLASGGAVYIRDPAHTLGQWQLNGGDFTPFRDVDWDLIRPQLETNAELFNIPVERLLEWNNSTHLPSEIYRKVIPSKSQPLDPEAAWLARSD